MRHYIALIHRDATSDYGLSFPDLPGCVTAGATLDEARAFAVEALAMHLAGLAEDSEAVPDPSSLETIMADVDNCEAVAVLVHVESVAAPRVVRVNISLPEDVLTRIDAHAARSGLSRSGFLAKAAQREIERA